MAVNLAGVVDRWGVRAGARRRGGFLSGWVKDGSDRLLAVVALVVLLPVWVVIALVIKFDDGGPVVYTQQRIGLDGRPFMLHKFRTMTPGADELYGRIVESHSGEYLCFKLKDDPRVTRAGRVLRRLSLDETPQFIDILCGRMSLVGPRPQLAVEVAEFLPHHFVRLTAKPGLTGLRQVSGRSDLTPAQAMDLDLYYVKNQSLKLDLAILAKTIPAVITGRGAY
jgi:lipopolysaccharide/colanic/teichoic acid biosynthesis glycosyltransferase